MITLNFLGATSTLSGEGTERKSLGNRMSHIWGNVFQKGETACLCKLEIEGDFLRAEPKDPTLEDLVFRFPLRHECLSFGGDGDSQLILKDGDSTTLYAERTALVPLLESVEDPVFQARIKNEAKRAVKNSRLSLALFFSFFLGCGLLVAAFIGLLNWGVDRAVDQIPLSWEESLGELVVDGDGSFGEKLSDPRLVEPIQKIVDRLAEAEPEQPYTLTVHVVKNDAVNALAAPGGQIVVFTGLLEKVKQPEELAGVLAHELQHVFHRHGLRNMVHSVKWQIVSAVLLGDAGAVQKAVLGRAPQFLSLSYGRSLEEEADLDGAKLLVRAQISPQGISDFFRLLEAEEKKGLYIPEFLSSHPETGSRIENLERWASSLETNKYKALNVDWLGLKSALEISSEETSPEEIVPSEEE